ncbi:MAG: glycosyltransferase family 2 protein, partial [Leptolyngbya sp. ERB_1_2]
MGVKFSLIVCTLGRIEPLRQFLNSLLVQTHLSFEVILVDQNEHNRIEELLEHYKSLEIRRFRSSPGLSRARNIGIQQA